MDDRDDYVLGPNVTKQALGKERMASVVSIRLSSEEMYAVTAVAEREGKTFAQVVREAIKEAASAKRRDSGWSAAVSFLDGSGARFGDPAVAQSVGRHAMFARFLIHHAGQDDASEEQGAVLDATAGRGL